mmetsp:Transcript_4820/g.11927  ORF Transcript_4820/g.11927 Transcript_4820/m.11927 type:complete len:212 (-) Transcript_4820:213-848(-)
MSKVTLSASRSLSVVCDPPPPFASKLRLMLARSRYAASISSGLASVMTGGIGVAGSASFARGNAGFAPPPSAVVDTIGALYDDEDNKGEVSSLSSCSLLLLLLLLLLFPPPPPPLPPPLPLLLFPPLVSSTTCTSSAAAYSVRMSAASFRKAFATSRENRGDLFSSAARSSSTSVALARGTAVSRHLERFTSSCGSHSSSIKPFSSHHVWL